VNPNFQFDPDTQLFLCFHPFDFNSCITHLHKALQQMSSWMTANLLTLNSSKTEFLLTGLKQQAKIHDSTLNTTHFVRNLGFYVISNQICTLSKSYSYYIHELCCISTYLNFKITSTFPLPIHSKPGVILSITTVQIFKLSGSYRV